MNRRQKRHIKGRTIFTPQQRLHKQTFAYVCADTCRYINKQTNRRTDGQTDRDTYANARHKQIYALFRALPCIQFRQAQAISLA